MKRNQRGAVLVELAIVLPFFAVLIVGIVSFGLILREFAVLQNGAREGARLSVLPEYRIAGGLTAADRTAKLNAIKQRVVDYVAEEGITVDPADVTVDQTGTSVDLGGGVFARASHITVSYTRALLFSAFPSVTLKGDATWRNLY
jgi:Flp pilus assembly protein TadG